MTLKILAFYEIFGYVAGEMSPFSPWRMHVFKHSQRRRVGGKGEGVTHDLTYHNHMTVDLASLQSRDGARRVSAGPGSQSITKREGRDVFGDSHEG